MPVLIARRSREFQLDPNDAPQAGQSIAPLAGGGFVVVWQEDGADGDFHGIQARLFSADGTPLGDVIQVNTQTRLSQLEPSVTGLASGGFAVSWTQQNSDPTVGDGDGTSIKGRIFDAGGTAVSDEYQVNTTTLNDQADPHLFFLPNGGFVASWYDPGPTLGDPRWDVRAQIFDEHGAHPAATEIFVNSAYSAGFQSQSVGAAVGTDRIVFLWTDQEPQGGDADTSVKAQIYDLTGQKVGSAFLVATHTASSQTSPDVASLPGGGFVAAWSSYVDGWHQVRVQIFDRDGAKLGPELTASAPGVGASNPSIVALDWGGFLVAWDEVTPWPHTYSVQAQLFDGEGNKVGDRIQVNDVEPFANGRVDLAVLASGEVVATWKNDDHYAALADQGLKAQILVMPTVGTSARTAWLEPAATIPSAACPATTSSTAAPATTR